MGFLDLLTQPRIHVRLRTGHDISVSADGRTFNLESYGFSRALGPANPHFTVALPELRAGAPLAALRDRVLTASSAETAAAFLLLLKRLATIGIVEYPLQGDDRCLAVVLPQRFDVVPAPASDERAARPLSRFAFLRRSGETWLLEHPLVGARLSFSDPSIASRVLGNVEQEPASEELRLVRAVAAGLGFLADDDGEEAAGGAGRPDVLRQWDFHDLAFHFHSRRGWHTDLVGGVFPHVGDIAPEPAVRPAWSGVEIPLDRAPADMTSAPLAEIVRRRRSHRAYADGSAPSLPQLGVFLDRVARVQGMWTVPVSNFFGRKTDMEVTSRPYPNGGASYELEIYAVVDSCDGLDSGLYHYDAGRHVLVRLTTRTPEVGQMLRDATAASAGIVASPQILFAITARFSRVMWKYKSIAYAVILRNTGVLYQAMYLAATDLGLSPCGIGSGNSRLFAAATGLDPVIEGTVGEFLLGGRPKE